MRENRLRWLFQCDYYNYVFIPDDAVSTYVYINFPLSWRNDRIPNICIHVRSRQLHASLPILFHMQFFGYSATRANPHDYNC